jgi:LPS sulfotransferase NodH
MKAIIITSQRSGSNFLHYCLESHPKIISEGELLIGGQIEPPRIIKKSWRRWRLLTKIYRWLRAGAWNPVQILENFYARTDAPVVIFKAMYNQLSSPKVHEYLREHPDIRVIHLRRGNLLKQYVSKMLMGKKRDGVWQPHSTSKLPVVTTHVSPQEAIREMRYVQQQFDLYEDLLSKHNKIELVYEDMINGQCLSDAAMHAICELLEVEPVPMCCDFVKVNPNKLELMVENYQELSSALTGTVFEKYLRD